MFFFFFFLLSEVATHELGIQNKGPLSACEICHLNRAERSHRNLCAEAVAADILQQDNDPLVSGDQWMDRTTMGYIYAKAILRKVNNEPDLFLFRLMGFSGI